MASVLRAAIARVASSFASAALPATNCSKPFLNTARLFSTCLLHGPSSSTHISSGLAHLAFKAPILSIASRLSPGPVTFTPSRCYHMRLAVKRRCASCFFVRRKGRLYVECKAKPRHKQMQMMSKRRIWRDDYSKGNVERAVWWKYNEEKQYYKLGDNQWARFDWLKGRIGVNL